MLHKTRAIVLHSLDYNDRYRIVQLYTEEFGRVPYLLAKSKGKKTKTPAALFHPLAVVSMEVEHFKLRDIQLIKEARTELPLSSLPFHPVKISLALFLAEFLYKVAKEEQANKPLFTFVLQSIQILDLLEENIANFHLSFLVQLTKHVGIFPNAEQYTESSYFDLRDGSFVLSQPLHPHFLAPAESKLFHYLLRMNYSNMHAFSFSRQNRVAIIQHILHYYQVHYSTISELKSIEILQMLFN